MMSPFLLRCFFILTLMDPSLVLSVRMDRGLFHPQGGQDDPHMAIPSGCSTETTGMPGIPVVSVEHHDVEHRLRACSPGPTPAVEPESSDPDADLRLFADTLLDLSTLSLTPRWSAPRTFTISASGTTNSGEKQRIRTYVIKQFFEENLDGRGDNVTVDNSGDYSITVTLGAQWAAKVCSSNKGPWITVICGSFSTHSTIMHLDKKMSLVPCACATLAM